MTPVRARSRTARSRDERASIEATASPVCSLSWYKFSKVNISFLLWICFQPEWNILFSDAQDIRDGSLFFQRGLGFGNFMGQYFVFLSIRFGMIVFGWAIFFRGFSFSGKKVQPPHPSPLSKNILLRFLGLLSTYDACYRRIVRTCP